MMNTFKTDAVIPALTAIKLDTTRAAAILDPVTAQGFPMVDGVSLAPSGYGMVEIANRYGTKYEVSSAAFAPGHLYAGAGGQITQDFAAASATGWVVCVGRSVSPTEFIYEPHIPTRFPFVANY
jgi:ABC-type uncharacterized transport system permease subunit